MLHVGRMGVPRCDWDHRCPSFANHMVLMKLEPTDRLPSPSRLCEQHHKLAVQKGRLYDRATGRPILADGSLGEREQLRPLDLSSLRKRSAPTRAEAEAKKGSRSKFPQPMPIGWRLGDPISFAKPDELDDLPDIKIETKANSKPLKPVKPAKEPKKQREPAETKPARRGYTRGNGGMNRTDQAIAYLQRNPWSTQSDIRRHLGDYPHMSGLMSLLKKQGKVEVQDSGLRGRSGGSRYAVKGTPLPK